MLYKDTTFFTNLSIQFCLLRLLLLLLKVLKKVLCLFLFVFRRKVFILWIILLRIN